MAAEIREDPLKWARLTALFDACFRIQQEASEAAGRHIPMCVENVKGAQPWVGAARAHFGSYYLWGNVESVGGAVVATRPQFGEVLRAGRREMKVPGFNFHEFEQTGQPGRSFQSAAVAVATKNTGGSWFGVAHNTESGTGQNPVNGVKVGGIDWNDRSKPAKGFNVTAAQQYREGLKGPGGDWFANGRQGQDACAEGVKQAGLSGPAWWDSGMAAKSSRSDSRKAASAMIAEIPLPLARYIARCFHPRRGASKMDAWPISNALNPVSDSNFEAST